MSLINFKIKVIIYLFLLGCVIPGYYYNLNEKSMLKWIKKKKKNLKFKISFETVYYSSYMRQLIDGINCHFAKWIIFCININYYTTKFTLKKF